jgi:hypothetical protein
MVTTISCDGNYENDGFNDDIIVDGMDNKTPAIITLFQIKKLTLFSHYFLLESALFLYYSHKLNILVPNKTNVSLI